MLMQQRQELVAEVLLPLGPMVLQRLELLAVAQGIQVVVLVQGCSVQCGLHVLQLTCHLHTCM